MTGAPRYQRVLLKVSGEALMGRREYGLDTETVARIAQDIGTVVAMGVQVCLVIGGGNIFRGVSAAAGGMGRAPGAGMGLRAPGLPGLALERGCDALLKGTQVDGVYSADPRRVADAERYDQLTYHDVLARDLAVMDAAAISLARENDLPIIVFNIHAIGAFAAVMRGEGRFTTIVEPG